MIQGGSAVGGIISGGPQGASRTVRLNFRAVHLLLSAFTPAIIDALVG
jgi:hypothetical protein